MTRPSSFTEEMGDEICRRLIEGESLRSICASEGFPAQSTVCRWLANNETFRKQYAHARELQADALFDEVLDIADNGTNDWMQRNGEGDEGWALNGEHIQRSRVRIDARKWMAGKLRPKVYGDKLNLEGAGENGEIIFKTVIEQAPK
jgi:hypothetical protein